jgi:hypothetical protein
MGTYKYSMSKIEDRLAKLEGDVKLVKWMMETLITMNIGIILMLIKVLSALPK